MFGAKTVEAIELPLRVVGQMGPRFGVLIGLHISVQHYGNVASFQITLGFLYITGLLLVHLYHLFDGQETVVISRELRHYVGSAVSYFRGHFLLITTSIRQVLQNI